MGLPYTPSGPFAHTSRIMDPAVQECSYRQCASIGVLCSYLAVHQLSKCRVHMVELPDSSGVLTEHP
eukprot:9404235-Lingulodinium_polyedra.AAC.1